MEKTHKYTLDVLGIPVAFDITVVIMTTITCLAVFIIMMIAVRRPTLVPKGLQNFIEMIIDFIKGIVNANLDVKTGYRFYGFAFTLFLFVLFFFVWR